MIKASNAIRGNHSGKSAGSDLMSLYKIVTSENTNITQAMMESREVSRVIVLVLSMLTKNKTNQEIEPCNNN